VRGSLSFPPGMGIAVLNAMPSPRRAIRREPTHGFTLLEIMVVIALISLLTTGVAVGAIRTAASVDICMIQFRNCDTPGINDEIALPCT
jgi:prepilin-type N-terminal cleavage/methylation domain-containing protein